MSVKKEKQDWSLDESKPESSSPRFDFGDTKNSSDSEDSGILNFFNVSEPADSYENVEPISAAPVAPAPEEIAESEEKISFFSPPDESPIQIKHEVDHKFKLDLFYQIKNLNSFYKTARSYLADYNHGVRSFAIACEHSDQRPSLNALALASFFQNKFDGITVFILAPKNVLESYDHESQIERIETPDCSVDITLYHYGAHARAISIEELTDVNAKLGDFKDFFEVMKVLVSRYDVSFWSLPHYNELKDMKKFLFILTNFVQNVSIVIKRGKTTQRGLRDLKRFFQNYNVPVKGVLVEG